MSDGDKIVAAILAVGFASKNVGVARQEAFVNIYEYMLGELEKLHKPDQAQSTVLSEVVRSHQEKS